MALGKPATQTDTAGGADPKLAVDGDTTTCSRTDSFTAEWELDLEEYYLIEDVSIVSGMLVLVSPHDLHTNT